MPKFSGHKRDRPMRFLRDFERYISAIDINTNDFNYIIYTCLEGIAREWWELVSQNNENINSFREKFIKKYCNENVCFQNVSTQNTGATESTRICETGVRRGNPGNAQDAIGKVRVWNNKIKKSIYQSTSD